MSSGRVASGSGVHNASELWDVSLEAAKRECSKLGIPEEYEVVHGKVVTEILLELQKTHPQFFVTGVIDSPYPEENINRKAKSRAIDEWRKKGRRGTHVPYEDGDTECQKSVPSEDGDSIFLNKIDEILNDEKQYKIICLLLQGHFKKDIAKKVQLSPHLLKKEINKINQKLKSFFKIEIDLIKIIKENIN